MTADTDRRADCVVNDAKAQRPRWRSAALRAPAWFAGEELDLLQAAERDELYLEERSRHPPVQWLPILIALLALLNVVRNLQPTEGRGLWIAATVGLVFLGVGAWLYRRRLILIAARRHVRESPDWPLRLQKVASTDLA
jgi:hypothetical protein